MKNFKLKICSISICLLLSFLSFNSCKTLPIGNKVQPLDLLDNSSDIYFSVPNSVDPDLIKTILMFNLKNLSESDAQKVSNNINTVYCGVTRNLNKVEYQISLDGNIPLNFVSSAFSSKNGWSTLKYTPQGSSANYKIYNSPQFEISFPSQNIALIGRNLPQMLQKYHNIYCAIPDQELNYSDLDAYVYQWLTQSQEEIRFYSGQPQSLLSLLTGAQLNLQLFYIKGTLYTDPDNPDFYITNLNFMFNNEKYTKAGKTLLAFTFGLSDEQSVQLNSNELIISGIKLKKQQIYKFFME